MSVAGLLIMIGVCDVTDVRDVRGVVELWIY